KEIFDPALGEAVEPALLGERGEDTAVAVGAGEETAGGVAERPAGVAVEDRQFALREEVKVAEAEIADLRPGQKFVGLGVGRAAGQDQERQCRAVPASPGGDFFKMN